jgi:hypothetical protein
VSKVAGTLRRRRDSELAYLARDAEPGGPRGVPTLRVGAILAHVPQTARASRGALFLREAEDRAASLTFWEDWGVLEALTSSPSYRETTHELAESAFLAGDHSAEALEVEGEDLRLEALQGALDRRILS